MKRIICLASAAVLLLCLGVFAFADAAVTFNSEETDSGYKVTLDTSGFPGIAMMQFNIEYDASKLSCTGTKTGTALAGNTGPTVNANNPGKIIFVWDSLKSISSDGSLIEISFDRIADGAASVGIDTGSTVIFAKGDFSEPAISMTGISLGSDVQPEPVTHTDSSEQTATNDISSSAVPGSTSEPDSVASPAETVSPSQSVNPFLSNAPSNGNAPITTVPSPSAAQKNDVTDDTEQGKASAEQSEGVPDVQDSADRNSEDERESTAEQQNPSSEQRDPLIIYLLAGALLICLIVFIIWKVV